MLDQTKQINRALPSLNRGSVDIVPFLTYFFVQIFTFYFFCRKLLNGVKRFNLDPEEGLKYLQEFNFIDNTPESVAKFLFRQERLSKKQIGKIVTLYKGIGPWHETLIFQSLQSTSLPSNVVDHRYIKLRSLIDKYQRLTPSGCKDIGLENLSWWQRHNLDFLELSQINV